MEAEQVNHYGIRARDHWREHLPDRLAQIPDPEEFFTLLGEMAETEIGHRAEALELLTQPAEGYLAEVARLETPRVVAEMEVLRELILVDPDNLEAVGQLLG
jgi:hypothetical protein